MENRLQVVVRCHWRLVISFMPVCLTPPGPLYLSAGTNYPPNTRPFLTLHLTCSLQESRGYPFLKNPINTTVARAHTIYTTQSSPSPICPSQPNYKLSQRQLGTFLKIFSFYSLLEYKITESSIGFIFIRKTAFT